MATNLPIIPENIIVHLGRPGDGGANVTVPFTDYIKNVASSEIYPTWPDNAIRANIYAIISYALNRIYTEYYRSRGYDFDITNTTQFDQSYQPGRDVFENISRIVDDIFNSYVVKQGSIEPYFTAFCNGTTTQCEGLSQWGTVSLAEKGLSPYQILQNYYGDDINIEMNVPVQNIEESYPGYPLLSGSFGNDVKTIQVQLNRIRKNYPSIPLIPVIDGVFGPKTRDAVKGFQKIFNLTQDGIVGKATWYKIKQIYNGVKKLNELKSEGLVYDEISNLFPTELKPGDTGIYVRALQYYLTIIRYNYNFVPAVEETGVYDRQTEEAVRAFQTISGLEPTGIADQKTINELIIQYYIIVDSFPEGFTGKKTAIFPGYFLKEGMKNNDVRDFQTYLAAISKAYPNIPSVTVNGEFDAVTVAAVRAFQKEFGLPVTGQVGPITWNSIATVYENL